MTLRNLTIPKAVILVGDEPFTVSGVTASQVFTLYRRHKDDLSSLYDSISGRGKIETSDSISGRGKIETSDILNSVEGIIAMFPDLVAETITLASGESPDAADWEDVVAVAARLPLTYQVEALMKIGELTFSPEMPPKKFFDLLVAMIQQVNNKSKTLEVGSGN